MHCISSLTQSIFPADLDTINGAPGRGGHEDGYFTFDNYKGPEQT
jgi:hypothetical protein